MTAPARIKQDDWDRATKAVVNAGLHRARIIGDLKKGTIEIIIGESADVPPSPPQPWEDDDV